MPVPRPTTTGAAHAALTRAVDGRDADLDALSIALALVEDLAVLTRAGRCGPLRPSSLQQIRVVEKLAQIHGATRVFAGFTRRGQRDAHGSVNEAVNKRTGLFAVFEP